MVHPSATTSKIDRIPQILVGVDGTAASWDALAWAEEELMTHSTDAGPRHLLMCRAYSADTTVGRLPNAVDSATLARLDPGLYRRLRSTRQRWASDDITVDRYAGSLATQLIAHATPNTVAVIGASARDTAVVTRVAASARGVVVVVRATTPPIELTGGPFAGHVIVGVDGRSSAAAVRFAFDYAARHRCPVAAVHADAHDDAGAWVDGDQAQIHVMPHAFELDLIEGAVMEAHRLNPDVRGRRFVLRQRAAEALVIASSGAALLVVGDRGRPAIPRRLLGSVSRHVLGRAHCSVAVVHDWGGPSCP
jgi:nucleotide-binding universal stress UspA family protein